jgi:hypothetical protein
MKFCLLDLLFLLLCQCSFLYNLMIELSQAAMRSYGHPHVCNNRIERDKFATCDGRAGFFSEFFLFK